MSFKDELENILDKLLYDLTTKKSNVVPTATQSIINLVDKEVIGEDDTAFELYGSLADHQDHQAVEARNNLRAEQRAKLKGVNNG